MLICHCHCLTCSQIKQASKYCKSCKQIFNYFNKNNPSCGGCVPEILKILRESDKVNNKEEINNPKHRNVLNMTSNKKNEIMDKSFKISISFEYDYSLDELWPDGDAPENPTVQDVVDLIEQCGGVRQVLHDWDMDRYLKCTVTDGDKIKSIESGDLFSCLNY